MKTITIILPKNALDTSGTFYFFLKSIAWEDIVVHELFTMREEFTIVVPENDANKTFGIVNSLFSKKPEVF